MYRDPDGNLVSHDPLNGDIETLVGNNTFVSGQIKQFNLNVLYTENKGKNELNIISKFCDNKFDIRIWIFATKFMCIDFFLTL